jgi:hypothetical protein
MSQYKEFIHADVMGRVMSLEQRTNGLRGRISALEARLSGAPGDNGTCDPDISEDVEFVPAVRLSGFCPVQGTPGAQLSVPGQMMKPGSNHAIKQQVALSPVDLTGVVAGIILVGAGILLYTENIDVIKNPLLSLGCGIFLILLSLGRSLLLKTILTKNIE